VAQFLISLTGVLVLAGLAWGVAALLLGRDPGLEPAEPDGRGIPLPAARPLTESDLGVVRFDTAPRGYRMLQVDSALRRAAYDIGYKEELIGVLEAEVAALRDGRLDEAEALRQARETASRPRTEPEPEDVADDRGETETEPVVLGTFQLGAGPTIGALPGEPAVAVPVESQPAESQLAESQLAESPAELPAGSQPVEEQPAGSPSVAETAEPTVGATPAGEPAADDPPAQAQPAAKTGQTPAVKPSAVKVSAVEPDAVADESGEPEPDAVAEPDDSVDGDAEPEPGAEEPGAVEPDDSVDTDLAPAGRGGSDQPTRPADGER
jgi:DivIVA domain-containing protein